MTKSVDLKGNVLSFTQEEELEFEEMSLFSAKSNACTLTNREALARILPINEFFSRLDTLDFLKAFWPVLDTVKAPKDFKLIMDINTYREQKIAEIQAMTILAEITAYDPVTDPNWPE